MVRNVYQESTFIVIGTGNGPNSWPEQFLNKDNIEVVVDFENQTDDEIILLNILRKNFQVLQNHILIAFTVEQVEFLLVFLSLAYFLICHSLLNWYL